MNAVEGSEVSVSIHTIRNRHNIDLLLLYQFILPTQRYFKGIHLLGGLTPYVGCEVQFSVIPLVPKMPPT